jgi:hypothetical protein
MIELNTTVIWYYYDVAFIYKIVIDFKCSTSKKVPRRQTDLHTQKLLETIDLLCRIPNTFPSTIVFVVEV